VYDLVGRIRLHGDFARAYTHGDNSAIVPTETQKNSFYALSKKYEVSPVEAWVVAVGDDILARHPHIEGATVGVVQTPWARATSGGKEHNHVFLKQACGVRTAEVRLSRTVGSRAAPSISSLTQGFADLSIMKTTQSGFAGFIKDEYTTLPDSTDRVLATKITCSWTFTNVSRQLLSSLDFNQMYEAIQQAIIESFAGPADVGVFSASVQATLYKVGCEVLARFKDIERISFSLPNIHYYGVDFSKFKTTLTNHNEVFFTFDGAHGIIEAEVVRKGARIAAKL
jgi:urate oxidase